MVTLNDVELFTSAEYKALDKQSRRKAYDNIRKLMDDTDPASDTWSAYYEIYCWYNAVDDEEYREENMAEFKAYEARMNEPDFDWDYYSDWHKDMFGYRPHFKAIPVDEDARQRMCECWHAERGL